jgi:hypothetical protein
MDARRRKESHCIQHGGKCASKGLCWLRRSSRCCHGLAWIELCRVGRNSIDAIEKQPVGQGSHLGIRQLVAAVQILDLIVSAALVWMLGEICLNEVLQGS